MGFPISMLRKRLLLIVCLLMLGATGGCKQSPWTLWDSYSSRFIDTQGRVIDPQGGGRSTSEGQAYAMFFALADNDRACFDRVLTWTQANMASGDLQIHLPSWLWGKNKDGEWKTIDPNSASDADVWMAYTLVEAGRLWKAPAYTNLGRRMMAQIAKSEVADLPGFGLMLMPGPIGYQHGQVWTLNPSYLPLFIFDRLATIDPSGPWREVAINIPRLLQQLAMGLPWIGWTMFRGTGSIPLRRFMPMERPLIRHWVVTMRSVSTCGRGCSMAAARRASRCSAPFQP
jgi:endoglucanase